MGEEDLEEDDHARCTCLGILSSVICGELTMTLQRLTPLLAHFPTQIALLRYVSHQRWLAMTAGLWIIAWRT